MGCQHFITFFIKGFGVQGVFFSVYVTCWEMGQMVPLTQTKEDDEEFELQKREYLYPWSSKSSHLACFESLNAT